MARGVHIHISPSPVQQPAAESARPSSQYEVITYSGTNFICSAGSTPYVMPHMHREVELVLILDGCQKVITQGQGYVVDGGDLFLINAYQTHENISTIKGRPYTYVELQLPVGFFKPYYPQIEQTVFEQVHLCDGTVGPRALHEIRDGLLTVAQLYFARPVRYELKCAANINLLFDHLLEYVPNRVLQEDEAQAASRKNARIARITAYIEENCDRKLLLSEIADNEQLSMTYLSHLLTDAYGMTFQDYLLHVRCQKAQELLTTTDMKLTDICYACGFSSIKYMNRGFEELFGVLPKAYRTENTRRISDPEMVPLTNMTPVAPRQVNYSPAESLDLLERFRTAEQAGLS